MPITAGEIWYQGNNLLNSQAHQVVSLGIAHVPEGRGIFASLTVLENLKLATWTLKKNSQLDELFQGVFELFPRLEERLGQIAGTLSGGEQQMLVLGRAMMTDAE